MTLIELIYFVAVIGGASFAARWMYPRDGWAWAIVTFTLVSWLGIRFFLAGGFRRLVLFIFRPTDLENSSAD